MQHADCLTDRETGPESDAMPRGRYERKVVSKIRHESVEYQHQLAALRHDDRGTLVATEPAHDMHKSRGRTNKAHGRVSLVY